MSSLTARSEQALAFLESYPRDFLQQLTDSLREVSEAPTGKRRKGRPVPGIELGLVSRKTGSVVRFASGTDSQQPESRALPR